MALLSLAGCMRAGGQVKLRGGGVVEYDWLVLAMGASTTFFDIPGVKELTFPFCDYKDAMRVTIPSLPSSCPFSWLPLKFPGWHSAHIPLPQLQGCHAGSQLSFLADCFLLAWFPRDVLVVHLIHLVAAAWLKLSMLVLVRPGPGLVCCKYLLR